MRWSSFVFILLLLCPAIGFAQPNADAGINTQQNNPDGSLPVTPVSQDAGTPQDPDASVEQPTQPTQQGGMQIQPSQQQQAVLFDANPVAAVPQAGVYVTAVLQQELEQRGFRVVGSNQYLPVARSLNLPVGMFTGETMNTIAQAMGAQVAVGADVFDMGVYYRVVLRARLSTDPLEHVVQVFGTQWTLGDSLRQGLATVLTPTPVSTQTPANWGYPPLPDMRNYTPPPRIPPTRLHPNPVELSLGVEFAVGPGQDAFFNFLAPIRGTWYPIDRFGITASVAYANLRGRNDRVSNILPMIGVETGIEILSQRRLYMPLRAEVGYLPFNGVVIRATIGGVIPFTRSIGLELDVLSVSTWFIPGTVAVSLNFGAALVIGFGAPPENTNTQQPQRRRRRRRPAPENSQTNGNTSPSSNSPSNSPSNPVGNTAPVPVTQPSQ